MINGLISSISISLFFSLTALAGDGLVVTGEEESISTESKTEVVPSAVLPAAVSGPSDHSGGSKEPSARKVTVKMTFIDHTQKGQGKTISVEILPGRIPNLAAVKESVEKRNACMADFVEPIARALGALDVKEQAEWLNQFGIRDLEFEFSLSAEEGINPGYVSQVFSATERADGKVKPLNSVQNPLSLCDSGTRVKQRNPSEISAILKDFLKGNITQTRIMRMGGYALKNPNDKLSGANIKKGETIQLPFNGWTADFSAKNARRNNCMIQKGGQLEVLSTSDSMAYVRYQNPKKANGGCPDGSEFHMERADLAVMK